jgi:hypothetical protein
MLMNPTCALGVFASTKISQSIKGGVGLDDKILIGGQSPSSQTVESLLRTCWQANQSR